MLSCRILALILAFAAQIASAQKPALQEIADRWVGEYDNHLQVRVLRPPAGGTRSRRAHVAGGL